MSNIAIQTNNIHKYFGDKKVLTGIDLKIKEGESHVLIGGSGSGKSVLIKIIAGLMSATIGEVSFFDEQIKYSRNRLNYDQIGMLFQGGALFDSLPVWHNITFGLLQKNEIEIKDAPEIAIEKLKMVGLDSDSAFKTPSELSGGMQKRVALARAIASNPKVLFFDEPTTGLDPIMANVINHLIVKCSKELGATTLTITHDIHSAKTIADKASMLYKGKLIWQGDRDHLDKPDNEYLAQFLSGNLNGPIQF